MPGNHQTRRVTLAENYETSQPVIARFTVSPWAHRWSGYNRTPKQQAGISKLQSAHARVRWHGYGYARIGERDRDICSLTGQGLTDRQIADRVNDTHLWHLVPITRRQVCNIRHEHEDCSSYCKRLDLLETWATPAPANPNPTPDRAITDDGGMDTANHRSDDAAGLAAVSIPTSSAISDRHFQRHVWRTINTRYGPLTYRHDVLRYPLKPPGG